MSDGFIVRMYKKYEELIKYGIFGVLTTIVSWGTYAIFVRLGIEVNSSNILSWICGVTFAFVTNKWFVFNSKSLDGKTLFKEITTFLSSRVGTGIVAIVLFPILYNFGMNGEFLGTDGFLAKITTSVIEIILNWILSKYIVFNSDESKTNKKIEPDYSGLEEKAETEFTVCICAYNEEKNIEESIRSVYNQNLPGFVAKEVIVVSSGSTDNTDDIVRNLMTKYPTLKLIRQEKREGKNSAINCCLEQKTTDVVVLLNADNTLANKNSLYHLVKPFRLESTGMVGGHPIPLNKPDNEIGFAVCLVWEMHHQIALEYPKIGELVAFRDIGFSLRTDMQSDEDIIRMTLERSGYKCYYAEDATVYNRGPETREDFIKQRVRVNIGERTMKKNYDYDIPSWNVIYLLKSIIRCTGKLGFHPIYGAKAVLLELKTRKLADKHVKEGGDNMSIWDPVETTKKL